MRAELSGEADSVLQHRVPEREASSGVVRLIVVVEVVDVHVQNAGAQHREGDSRLRPSIKFHTLSTDDRSD
jgi:hypothetical protein